MRYLFLFFSCILLCNASCKSQNVERDLIYQVSTLNALMEGQYDGITPFAKLHHYGNFGVGTFDHLDGEMIGLDGQFYQIKSDGIVYPVKGSMKTPFADVTFFKADQVESLIGSENYQQLTEFVLGRLQDRDGFYAIRIEGHFQHVKTRSVHKQHKPYPPLTEAIANQIVFEYEQIEGTMVGFYMPETVEGVSAPGFHFHFISKDKTRGGHLLDCVIDQVKVYIDDSDHLELTKKEKREKGFTTKPKP